MKKILFLLSSIILTACGKTYTEAEKISGEKALTSEQIMSEVKHGLHRITIDDTTTILIYRGVESCTMIQIK
jgi:hypothetical protein